MDNFPRDPRKIKIRIGSYERALRREQQQYGFINDTFHLPLPNSGVTRDFPVLYREFLRIYETPLHSLAKFNDSKGMRLPGGNGK